MPRRERKYTLDTNLYSTAFRDPKANAALQVFHTVFAPFEYLSAVVVQELAAGVRTSAATHRLERLLFEPFQRRGRIITPSYAAWKRAGQVLSTLARREGLELRHITKSFANDVMLAVACREAGVVLVTENRRDFERIGNVISFEFVEPWPAPAG